MMPRLVRIMWPFVLAGVGFALARDHPGAQLIWTAAGLGCAGYGIYNLQRLQGGRRG